MKKVRFLHTADLHLDTPFKGVAAISSEIGTRLQDATFQTFRTIIDIAIQHEVDFILVAGDIYDVSEQSIRAQIFFRNELRRLEEKGIAAYIVHGNHDPLNSWSPSLSFPKNTHVFSADTVERFFVVKGGEKVAEIYGISVSQGNVLENLASLFPVVSQSQKNLVTIGMLHCNLGGRGVNADAVPCSEKDLLSKHYDYWALGHIHKKEIVSSSHPGIVYPGNPQGLHPNEEGERGCYLVEVERGGNVALRFVETAHIRWISHSISIEESETIDSLLSFMERSLASVREKMRNKTLICKIILTGRGPLAKVLRRKGVLDDLLKECQENVFVDRERVVWVERIINNTRLSFDRETLKDQQDFIGDLVRTFEEFAEEEKMGFLEKELSSLFLSPLGRKFLTPLETEYLRRVLAQSEEQCLDLLLDSQERNED